MDTQHGIHAVELSTYLLSDPPGTALQLSVVVSAPCKNGGLLEMMSLQPGESWGCDSQGESQDNCSAAHMCCSH